METQILAPTEEAVALAARILREGGLVGLPTETVYGLGANALDEAAVRAIFAAKGRPADNRSSCTCRRRRTPCRCATSAPPRAR